MSSKDKIPHFQGRSEYTSMRGRVNTGAIINNGVSTTWGRPGNSAAEKFKTFSSPLDEKRLPVMSSIPVKNAEFGTDTQTFLSDTTPSLRGSSQYKTVKALEVDRTPKSDDANQIDMNVYIGNSQSAQDLNWLMDTGITHIVNTAVEIPNYFDSKIGDRSSPQPFRFHYFNIPLRDNPTMGDEDLLSVLERTYRYMNAVIKLSPNTKILVHCHMGKSRSASVVIYYLMRSRGWSFVDALKFAQSKRSIVSPNMWYVRQLKDVDAMLRE